MSDSGHATSLGAAVVEWRMTAVRHLRLLLPLFVLALSCVAVSDNLHYYVLREDQHIFSDLAMALMQFTLIGVPTALLMILFSVLFLERPAKLLPALARAVPRFFLQARPLAASLAMVVVIQLFILGFGEIKSLITYVRPFAWDQTFAEMDRVLHFGHQPWELLQPILGYGPITQFISMNYFLWMFVLVMFWLHFAFQETDEKLRFQAIFAFMATWMIGGSLLATLLSSAGPCYYGKLGLGADPYEGLMHYLRETNEVWRIPSVQIQELLWENFSANKGHAMTKGISAMPSMHNAQALLLVLATWNKQLLLRSLCLFHLVLVFLGSIHLGWHYAVDAYLAFAIVVPVWVVAGWVARSWVDPQPRVQLQPQT